MLFENVRVHPLEFRNNITGELKTVFHGEVIELPEHIGKFYYNYLQPVVVNFETTTLNVEDIQNDVISEFNSSSDVTNISTIINKVDVINTPTNGENILVVEEEIKIKREKGRPKVYEETVTSAERRKMQRQAKKETEAKFKELKF